MRGYELCADHELAAIESGRCISAVCRHLKSDAAGRALRQEVLAIGLDEKHAASTCCERLTTFELGPGMAQAAADGRDFAGYRDLVHAF